MVLQQDADPLAGNIWTSYSTRDRVLLAVGSVLCYLIFHFIGRAFRIPELQDFQATLLGNPSPVGTVLVTIITFAACLLIGSLIAGTVQFEAGLFCACIGLMALSTRGGPMRYELMSSSGNTIWIRMIVETIILFGIVAMGWWVLAGLRDRNLLSGEQLIEDGPETLPGQELMALAMQVVATIILILLLAQTDQKAQVLWAIAIASYLAALGTHQLFPVRPSIWLWCAPFIVAVIGYICAMMAGGNLPGGQVPGMLPQLARPLPLDYASVGPAAALLGYWTSRKWQFEATQTDEETVETNAQVVDSR
jgi:hypothetical protein